MMTLPGFTEPQALARLLITDPSNAVSHMFTPLTAPCSLVDEVDAGTKIQTVKSIQTDLLKKKVRNVCCFNFQQIYLTVVLSVLGTRTNNVKC